MNNNNHNISSNKYPSEEKVAAAAVESLKLKSSKIISEHVVHGFFGRKGGTSSGNYSSLNCSRFVGDNEVSVLKNLSTIKNRLRIAKLITLSQVHGNLCVVIDQKSSESEIIKADAMVTKETDVALGILTADCAPILFFDPKNNIIGAAHAGWRGAVSGVIESTIEKMIQLNGRSSSSNIVRDTIRDIIVAIGPCIAKESYEIDDDFKRNFHGNGNCFSIINHRMHFDLPKYCFNRLIEAGINADNIDLLGIDTYADQENYFSYRFANQNTGGICGRNISVICMK